MLVEHRQPQADSVSHTEEPELRACITVHVLPGTLCKIVNFVPIVNVASYPKYKMFSNKVEM